jgi:integrase
MKITIRTRKIRNGNESIYLDYYDSGKRWVESLNLYLVPEVDKNAKAMNKAAMDKAVAIRAERVLGKQREPEEDQHTPLMSEWMETYVGKLAKRLKPDSLRHHHILVRTVNDYLSKVRKKQLTVNQWDKKLYNGFLSYLKNTYKVKRGENEYELQPMTLFNKQRQFNQMLNAAVKDGYLAENPYKRLSKSEKFKKPSESLEFLTKNEVKLMAETKTWSPRTKAGFMFCCFTGLRLSDLMALTWGDIHCTSTGMEIRLKAQQKTGRTVVIPLGENACKWLPEREGKSKTEKVFDLPERTTCRTCIKALAKRAGITKNINFHTSRHTFATLLISAGSDLYTVSKLLGHTSIKTTQIYADVLSETKLDAVNRVTSIFG